jgi:hypothetical protein
LERSNRPLADDNRPLADDNHPLADDILYKIYGFLIIKHRILPVSHETDVKHPVVREQPDETGMKHGNAVEFPALKKKRELFFSMDMKVLTDWQR